MGLCLDLCLGLGLDLGLGVGLNFSLGFSLGPGLVLSLDLCLGDGLGLCLSLGLGFILGPFFTINALKKGIPYFEPGLQAPTLSTAYQSSYRTSPASRSSPREFISGLTIDNL